MAISVYTSLLLKDYKRKAGEIKALRKELRELAKVVLKKERELAALNEILGSREPAFAPSNIKPIATYPKVLGLKWNRLTTLIYQCLREANGEPVTNIEIANYINKHENIVTNNRTALMTMRLCVRKRLKGLAAAGKVVGLHDKSSNLGASWILPSDK